MWGGGQRRSVLDLASPPKKSSAEIEVIQVWATSQMQHLAIFVWTLLGRLGEVLAPIIGEDGVIRHRPRP